MQAGRAANSHHFGPAAPSFSFVDRHFLLHRFIFVMIAARHMMAPLEGGGYFRKHQAIDAFHEGDETAELSPLQAADAGKNGCACYAIGTGCPGRSALDADSFLESRLMMGSSLYRRVNYRQP